MRFIPNIQFTCLIKCEGKQREFNFRKRNMAVVPYYDVDTVDLGGNRFQFSMDKAEDQWIIRELALPAWILDAETQLSIKILENDA
ncbi:MAG TPA: hypothetical protein VII28_05445 [Puia sp.]